MEDAAPVKAGIVQRRACCCCGINRILQVHAERSGQNIRKEQNLV
jgi:hypothetical protein